MLNKLLSWFLVLMFLCYNLDSPVCAYRYFRNGRLGQKRVKSEPSKYERWFTQNLDHFNPNDGRTWQQRYFVNEEYVDVNREVAFLQIGGEGEATADWMTNGSWVVYAKKFKPILFQLEHRYYGESHPTKDMSTENLVYLTSQQALSDLAFFIEAMNDQYELSPYVKWIVFGGSYPGSLAAWVRQKYPHLVHGAMSASGPVLAQLDFSEYFKVVADALRASNQTCANIVKRGTAEIDLMLEHMIGQRNLNKLFKLCDGIDKNIDNPLDVANFYNVLADNFAGVVQYNKDNRAATKKFNVTTDTLCDILLNQTLGPEVVRLAAVNSLILNISNETCLDYKYGKMIEDLRNISWDSEAAEGGAAHCANMYNPSDDDTPQLKAARVQIQDMIEKWIDL